MKTTKISVMAAMAAVMATMVFAGCSDTVGNDADKANTVVQSQTVAAAQAVAPEETQAQEQNRQTCENHLRYIFHLFSPIY